MKPHTHYGEWGKGVERGYVRRGKRIGGERFMGGMGKSVCVKV